MFPFLLWRVLALFAALLVGELLAWFIHGGPRQLLRARHPQQLHLPLFGPPRSLPHELLSPGLTSPFSGLATVLWVSLALAGVALVVRSRARARRSYLRLVVEPYRGDRAVAESLVGLYDALHRQLLDRWWRRLLVGQPSVSLEVHHVAASAPRAWLAVSCPRERRASVEAALRVAYPNCRLRESAAHLDVQPIVLRLKKHEHFIKRAKALDPFDQRREPPMNRLITTMAACGEPAFVQLTLTPAPASFERLARSAYQHHEARLSKQRRERLLLRDRSMVDEQELRGGLDLQHRPLFFVDLRVVAAKRRACETIAAQMRTGAAENRLVERSTAVRHRRLGLYARRIERGEGNPLPCLRKGVFSSSELAALWQLPSTDYATVPFGRSSLPLAPAPPAIMRVRSGHGTLRDAIGEVSIEPEMRRQNTAVPGTVEQGKSSYLTATVAEDLQRNRCAVILLDPKGDAADAALSLVPVERTCTLLDFSHPTCGFNPLAVDAPADVIADYVVGALKNLFTDAEIRASSDRYLRNAIIAVLAFERRATLWDAARLLSVGEEGYAYRRAVGARVRALPEMKEISAFFTAELAAQLADARSSTTAKLDAPVNKLARLLNSPSIKRVLLNDSLRVDFDRVISDQEVLVVKGALGVMGAGNTSVLMQLLIGMLDAALSRQQDLVRAGQRVAVALKIDEAPLVLNRGFAETMALKRSAGLETVACWQADAQWVDREVRDQLDALFAHRVYFATASPRDARSAASLTMAEYSDTIRPGIEHLSALGHPDVRLHLPKHHAIASWCTLAGRQAPFIAQTLPLRVDPERLATHVENQRARGARHQSDLRQPHWDHARAPSPAPEAAHGEIAITEAAGVRSDAVRAHEDSRGTASVEPSRASTPPVSYSELVELDRAVSARKVPRTVGTASSESEERDLEILLLVARLGHLLTSQIHRRFNRGRAHTTTTRRLKRMADAGLLERYQLHRRDGGGVPMCCAITPDGRELLERTRTYRALPPAEVSAGASSPRDPDLRRLRRHVHVAGWVLALERVAAGRTVALRGPREAVLTPPRRSGQDARPLGPADLRLPGGRAAHDFFCSEPSGRRVEADRFETIRPDAALELRPGASAGQGDARSEVLVELDDRLAGLRAAAMLERYDHFLSGWSLHVPRYGRRGEAEPAVVFICRDRTRAQECARRADALLGACRAYPGDYPWDWQYPGRARITFVAERDVHEARLCGYGVPPLPPHVRVAASKGDPRAAQASICSREVLAR